MLLFSRRLVWPAVCVRKRFIFLGCSSLVRLWRSDNNARLVLCHDRFNRLRRVVPHTDGRPRTQRGRVQRLAQWILSSSVLQNAVQICGQQRYGSGRVRRWVVSPCLSLRVARRATVNVRNQNAATTKLKRFPGCWAWKIWLVQRHGTRTPGKKLDHFAKHRLPEIQRDIIKNSTNGE